tara:strand:- start:107732 stop:110467 length:2736 start_codon:yes stop_codon:yes gene_type:complete
MKFDFWNAQQDIDLKVTQLSTNTTSFNLPRNISVLEKGIVTAAENNSDFLFTDEMNLMGYDSGDDFQHSDNEQTLERLNHLAKRAYALNPSLIVTVGHPWRANLDSFGLTLPELAKMFKDPVQMYKDPIVNRHGLPFNVMSTLGEGRVLAMSAKTHLFNDERGYEKRFFQEWSTNSPVIQALNGVFGTVPLSLTNDGQNIIPFGQPIIHVQDEDRESAYNFGQLICEMKWVGSQFDPMLEDDELYKGYNPLPAYARYLGSKDGLVMAIANASPPQREKILKHAHLARLASQFSDVVYDTDGLGTSGSTFAQMGHRLVAQDNRIMHSGSRLDFLDSAHSTSITKIQAAPKNTAAKAHVVLQRRFKDHFNEAGQKDSLFLGFEPSNQDNSWDKANFKGRFEEEELRMFALWTYDYIAKTKQNGVVQALSGGKDSAFNLTIAVLAMRIAIKQKGLKAVMNDFAHLPYADEILTIAEESDSEAATKELIKRFATGVTMPTGNNNAQSIQDAKELADGLGVAFHEHNVQDLVDYYAMLYAVKDTTKLNGKKKHLLQKEISAYLNQGKDSVSEEKLAKQAAAIKKKYPMVEKLITAANDADSVAYENIQARARQVFIMMYANTEFKMALANPNLDEALNAYATFGGDLHSGTVNINAGEYKHDQIKLMQHLAENGLHNVHAPMSFLNSTLASVPTAGLLPLGKKGEQLQTDEKAMEASSLQIKIFNGLMLKDKIGTNGGERRLNVEEVFLAAGAHEQFAALDDNQLYSTLRMRYAKWNGGPAQPKVHASPIAPTTGNNVDKQCSLKTPNISAANRDELTLLGVKLLMKFAKEDNAFWHNDRAVFKQLEFNALYNEDFIGAFEKSISNHEGLRFDVKSLYNALKDNGPHQYFKDVLRVKPNEGLQLNTTLNSITPRMN